MKNSSGIKSEGITFLNARAQIKGATLKTLKLVVLYEESNLFMKHC